MTTPSLTTMPARGTGRGQVRGVVLLLHGGAERGTEPVDRRSLSWRRAMLMALSLRRRVTGQGADLWLLRFRVRGWNAGLETLPSPVSDARWALEEVRRRHGSVPVSLVGHSMGGRTAVAVADDPDVVGVVGLAPWLPPGEPVRPLAGRHLAAAHGRSDQITSYDATRAFVVRASQVAASAVFEDMGEVGHYLLRRVRAWDRFTATQALAQLGLPPR
jgi:pimeloyl-ACP methyl ester carboxylesterase